MRAYAPQSRVRGCLGRGGPVPSPPRADRRGTPPPPLSPAGVNLLSEYVIAVKQGPRTSGSRSAMCAVWRCCCVCRERRRWSVSRSCACMDAICSRQRHRHRDRQHNDQITSACGKLARLTRQLLQRGDGLCLCADTGDAAAAAATAPRTGTGRPTRCRLPRPAAAAAVAGSSSSGQCGCGCGCEGVTVTGGSSRSGSREGRGGQRRAVLRRQQGLRGQERVRRALPLPRSGHSSSRTVSCLGLQRVRRGTSTGSSARRGMRAIRRSSRGGGGGWVTRRRGRGRGRSSSGGRHSGQQLL
jgi:hypothetical protein